MTGQLESALMQLSGGGAFEFSALLKMMPEMKSEEAERLRTRLMNDDRFFYRSSGGEFMLKEHFFRGQRFVVTPTDDEIEEGILFYGHRFAVYCAPEVFPSDAVLESADGAEIVQKEYTARLDKIFSYYMLLGSEQIFDCLIAEHPDNIKLRQSAAPSESITVAAADMADFYREHQFSSGDALLCEVTDYSRGIFRIEYLSGSERRSRDAVNWQQSFEAGLGEVIDEFRDYLEIPEQLKWAYFRSELPEAGALSMEEFVRRTEAFSLDCSGEYTVLSRCGQDDGFDFDPAGGEIDFGTAAQHCCGGAEEHHGDNCTCGECSAEDGEEETETDAGDFGIVPDGFGISRGETSDIQAMLTEAGSPLSPVEIDSYIMDMAYARELDFEQFYARVFGRDGLNFADEAQEAVFMNYIEDRYEQLTGGYQRYEDESKAPLRQLILELVDLKFDCGGEALPKGAEGIYRKLDRMLQVINRVDCVMDDADAEAMEEEIGKMREKLVPPEL